MNKEPQQIQINVDAVLYAISNMSIAFDEENFHFFITSGNQGRRFVASPKHAKRICLLLKQQLDKYEEKFGELKTALPQVPKNTQEQNKVGF